MTDDLTAGSGLTGDGWRLDRGGEVELLEGPHDGERPWIPAGPLRPWVIVLAPLDGRGLILVRVWRLDPQRPMTERGVAYRLTDSLTADGRPVYALERRRMPRRP